VNAHVMAQLQEQRKRKFRGRGRCIGRYIGDCDVELARRLHIDDIVPGEEHADITRLFELTQDFRGQVGPLVVIAISASCARATT